MPEAIIFSEDRYFHDDGIVVCEPRPGWVTLEVPPLEAWESRLLWLLPEQRERVDATAASSLRQGPQEWPALPIPMRKDGVG